MYTVIFTCKPPYGKVLIVLWTVEIGFRSFSSSLQLLLSFTNNASRD